MFDYINISEVTSIKKTGEGKIEFAYMGYNGVLSIEDATATTVMCVRSTTAISTRTS
jgi:hypothetical protein